MNRTRRLLWAVALLHAAILSAQGAVFRAGTWLVVLHATVMNDRGELVTNLTQRDFSVFENGKRQPLTLFRHDDVPVSLGMLIDNSGSMRALRPQVEAAALAFARASNPQDEMFVLNFADTPRVDVAMTSDLNALEAGIRRVDSIGGTAIRDAVALAEGYLHEQARWDRRVLLVITDGNDNASSTTVDRIRHDAEQTDTVIYAMGLFHAQDPHRAIDGRRELTDLTERTGGVSYFPVSVDEIQSVAVDLARQIRNQYTIGYSPLNQRLDGSYRTVRLAVMGPKSYKVRTKPGYRAVGESVMPEKR
jgi:VWFA-related protein